MPGVTGKQLDVAEDDLKQAGFDPDKLKIVGGGKLGIVVKSNWQVCAQVPAAGQPVPSVPQLTVARSCGGSAASTTSSGSEPASTPAPSTSPAAAALTVKNNKDLVALLKVGDYCSDTVQSFATKYAGRTIEFDGSISALAKHGDAETRYDVGIAPGDKGDSSSVGPAFQFRDVNLSYDLHLKGSNVPDSLAVGDKLRVVAEVGEFSADQGCLLQLTPVSTEVR